jgi:hypothetical protein
MPYRRDVEPSPLRTGIVHAGLSLLVFGGVAGALGVGIQFSGDPSAAGPRQQTDTSDTVMVAVLDDDGYAEVDSGDEPSLGVDYADGAEATGTGGPSDDPVADAAGSGVRINGKLVKPGESYGEVTAIVSLGSVPISGMSETINGVRCGRPGTCGRLCAAIRQSGPEAGCGACRRRPRHQCHAHQISDRGTAA